jgi:hypothetical protein
MALNDTDDVSYNFFQYHCPAYDEHCTKNVNQEFHAGTTTMSMKGFGF